MLERHRQRRRVARGARFVAVEHLLDLRQACARVGERVFAHQHLAVRELVGQLQTGDAGVVRDLLALGHDGAVEILHGLNVLRLGERGVVTVADDAHAFDLRGIRDAAGVAREVALRADHDEAAHGSRDRAAAPDRARDAQGLADDHLADDKAERCAEDCQQQERHQMYPVGRHVEQHAVHADRHCQTGEERHDVLQHRLEHRDGDGVARALHAAAPVELTRAHEQQQREHRPDERIYPAGEVGNGDLRPRAADRTHQIGVTDTCAPHEQHQRGEPVDRQIHHARHAVHEHVEHGLDEQLEAHGDEVHEQVQARQHDHMAGEHGAQHGDAVEHDRLKREHTQPDEQRLDDESEACRLDEHGETEDHGLGRKQHQKARQQMRAEHAPAPDRQGGSQSRAARRVQIAEHGGGCEQARAKRRQRQQHLRLGENDVREVADLIGRHIRYRRARVEQRTRQHDEQNDAVDDPQRPPARQALAKFRPVTEGCL